jgi:hypothetical protein
MLSSTITEIGTPMIQRAIDFMGNLLPLRLSPWRLRDCSVDAPLQGCRHNAGQAGEFPAAATTPH